MSLQKDKSCPCPMLNCSRRMDGRGADVSRNMMLFSNREDRVWISVLETSPAFDRNSTCENENLKSSSEFSNLNDAAFYQRFMPEWETKNETCHPEQRSRLPSG